MSLRISAHWSHLVMLNYEVDPEVLLPYVPDGVILDQFEGRTLASMVGFLFRRTSLWGIPVPFHQQFEEVNLRFYVRRELPNEIRRGVVFVKEIIPKPIVTNLARYFYNENYVTYPMAHQITAIDSADGLTNTQHIQFSWTTPQQQCHLGASISGSPFLPPEQSEETFISEHYYGYCTQKNSRTLEYKVEHPQWNVWKANSPTLECDVEQLYGKQFVPFLNAEPSSAFVAEGSEVTVGKSGWVT